MKGRKMSDVFIVGASCTPLGKHLDKSVKDLTALAVGAALADADCTAGDIEAAWFSNTRQGIMEGQHGIRGQCALRPSGLEGIPVINTDNACASSTTGLHQAFAYLKAGMADVALVVGAEKMNYPEQRELMFQAFLGSMDRELGEQHLQRAMDLSADFPLPPEARATNVVRSIFMDSYCASARFHMKTYGTTQRQFAEVASKNHWHSQFNPNAQYRTPMSVEEVLADKLITWPLTRAMCAPISDGASALIMCNADALSRFDKARAVPVLATVLTTGVSHDPRDGEQHIARIAAVKAYERAGISPGDVSIAELHDATAYGEIKLLEAFGFCAPGEGGPLTQTGATRLGGRLPVNVSGGLLSKGHPIGATGAIQIHELVVQLRGEAGQRQVEGARIAIAGNGGGMYEGEEAAMAATILGGPVRH
jgi:acetyl-CoA acyltransferase